MWDSCGRLTLNKLGDDGLCVGGILPVGLRRIVDNRKTTVAVIESCKGVAKGCKMSCKWVAKAVAKGVANEFQMGCEFVWESVLQILLTMSVTMWPLAALQCGASGAEGRSAVAARRSGAAPTRPREVHDGSGAGTADVHARSSTRSTNSEAAGASAHAAETLGRVDTAPHEAAQVLELLLSLLKRN